MYHLGEGTHRSVIGPGGPIADRWVTEPVDRLQIIENLKFKTTGSGPISHRSVLSGRPMTDGSPRPGDTRRHFEASNEIADDVIINQ